MKHRVHVHDGVVVFALPDPGSVERVEVQVALSLRHQATSRGVCPLCGARGPNRAERRRLARQKRGQVFEVTFWHAADCPVGDDRLRDLLREGGRAA